MATMHGKRKCYRARHRGRHHRTLHLTTAHSRPPPSACRVATRLNACMPTPTDALVCRISSRSTIPRSKAPVTRRTVAASGCSACSAPLATAVEALMVGKEPAFSAGNSPRTSVERHNAATPSSILILPFESPLLPLRAHVLCLIRGLARTSGAVLLSLTNFITDDLSTGVSARVRGRLAQSKCATQRPRTRPCCMPSGRDNWGRSEWDEIVKLLCALDGCAHVCHREGCH